ncbi:beta-L-arabinofuranosidase domain-containing protein [Niabella beijingensis]|uniref:beta-L-arabinofuranosidase domain-containing protein n=1 Tax=Niabella beijingensis TaxID=2872700 RepID=UPI001CBF68A9|nr:beta-L-arabinofuranosidase domain-containing protein [Niabella beijingensis]MBZ4189907.1 glycoside hydrolase family 127 protein [Niabella beijingensis]
MIVKRITQWLLVCVLCAVGSRAPAQVADVYEPLPPGAVKLEGYLQQYITHSIASWNKGVVPYDSLALLFRNGRAFFAQGEMWGKAVRSGCMFYRYNRDPGLKKILKQTVADLLSYTRENGSISCSAPAQQPDGPGGDIWERKYVMLALEGYYTDVEADPAVLKALVRQADVLLTQIGPPPKARITDLGWSPNHIESSTILEPLMRLYRLTGYQRYLDFCRYIVETEGGAKGENIIGSALLGKDPARIGGVYPKAYEMLSLFEGVVEYYRATKQEKWRTAVMNLFEKVKEKEITIIGNGGGDQPYHPAVLGEAWDYTALEQTNPDIQRMMETCVGVTWLKLCSQIFRLTGDASAMDRIEQYAYNGLLGAMKPEGDGFSYVNLLNGVKTNRTGWGGMISNVYVTCCNLNGPMGLAYLPYIAVMRSASGPVVNLFNAAAASMMLPSGNRLQLQIRSAFPQNGMVRIRVHTTKKEAVPVKIRIPSWSERTRVTVNGTTYKAVPGTYLEIKRNWNNDDEILMQLDMRCRILEAPRGSNRKGDHFMALRAGPVVLARDENLDPHYNEPVTLVHKNGVVAAKTVNAAGTHYQIIMEVPTAKGAVKMVDYASVNNWNGTHICTWIPDK